MARTHRIPDAELLEVFAECGNVAETARRLDYVQADWVRRRLRAAGVAPLKPGRAKAPAT
jgi:hypothetical protein